MQMFVGDFWKKSLMLSRQHLFDQKYSQISNIVIEFKMSNYFKL